MGHAPPTHQGRNRGLAPIARIRNHWGGTDFEGESARSSAFRADRPYSKSKGESVFGRSALVALALLLGLALAWSVPADAEPAPSDPTATRFIIETLESLAQEVEPQQPSDGAGSVSADAVARVLGAVTDVGRLAQRVAGPAWDRASPSDRAVYQEVYAAYLAEVIADAMGHLGSDDPIRALGQRSVDGGGTLVATRITPRTGSARVVQWLVLPGAETPRIADILVDGASMARTQREDFMTATGDRGTGLTDLTQRLKALTARLSGREPPQP
jgi:phospholipid transport system substrate-binding protein